MGNNNDDDNKNAMTYDFTYRSVAYLSNTFYLETVGKVCVELDKCK